jgi:hypothetical protein
MPASCVLSFGSGAAVSICICSFLFPGTDRECAFFPYRQWKARKRQCPRASDDEAIEAGASSGTTANRRTAPQTATFGDIQ